MVLPIGYLFVGIGIFILVLIVYSIYEHFKEKKRNATKINNDSEQDKKFDEHD